MVDSKKTSTPPTTSCNKVLSLASYLTRLVWLSVFPLLLLAVWLVYDSISAQQSERNREAQNMASNLASVIDQHLDARISALHMLVTSPLLDDRTRWLELYREAVGFHESFGSHVILASAEGPMQMLFNTRVPFSGTLPVLPRPKGRAAAPTAIATGKPAVGDQFIAPLAKVPMVSIAVPVQRAGKITFVMLTIFETSTFKTQLNQISLPEGWTLSLLDGRGDVIAHRAANIPDTNGSGDIARRFIAKSQVSPWSVVVEIKRNAYQTPLLVTAVLLGTGVFFTTLAGVLGGMLGCRRLNQAVDSLVNQTRDGVPSRIIEVEAMRTTLNEAFEAQNQARQLAQEQMEKANAARRDAEATLGALRKKEALLAIMGRTALIGGWDLDIASGEVSWTEEIARIHDLDPAMQPNREMGLSFYRPSSRSRLEAALAVAIQSGTPYDLELEIVSAKGASKWVRTIGQPVIENGALVKLHGSFQDITEQKRIDTALRESESRFRSIFDNSPIAIGIGDLGEETLIEVNPSWLRLFGFERREVIGRSATAMGLYLESSDRDNIVGVINRQGRIVNQDIRLRNRAGEIRDILLAAEIIVIDGSICLLMMMTDVTEQRQSEMALRESEERQRLFIEFAPAALAMFDQDMRYLHVSKRWRHDYGLGDHDLTGLSHYEVFPELPESWKGAHRRGMAGEVVRKEIDRFERANGTTQWLRWEIRPWRDSRGEIGGIVIFTEDITEVQQALEEISHLNADLERRVEERTAELQATNQELDAFAYAVSHDLRTPLRAMNGFSHALIEDYGEILDREGQDYLQEIVAASRIMGSLIDGLLSLSRSTRGELIRKPVDLSEIAFRIREELERSEPEHRVTWRISEGLQINGDSRMLEIALRNLLGNAWKYTSKTGEPTISIYKEERDGKQWFCVVDNGAGFDMAHTERLYKPFQRLHRQEEFSGIGIGLATVQRIIHRHGGTIQAEGEPGKGATFRFSLP